MGEAFIYAFHTVNLFPTILLLVTILYWLAVMLGALDVGFLDFDLDPDYETDVEIEVDVAGNPSPGAGFMETFLSFFNIGKIPVMVVFSFFSMCFWLIAININYYLGIENIVFSLIFYLPAIVVSMLVAKYCTWPMIPVFRALNEEGKSNHDLVGALGTMSIALSENKLGQAKVRKDLDSFIINVRSNGKQNEIKKGQQVIVVEYIESGGYYIVEPFEFS